MGETFPEEVESMSLRCAIYARYSSDQQSPLSISDQVRKCGEHAQQQSWSVLADHLYTDAEISGAGTDRPGLQKLLQVMQMRPRPFDVLLIDDTSRLSRRLADQANIIDQLRFAGFRLVAVSQGIDTASEQADVLMTVHGLVDSLYIKELAKKTHRGLEGRVLSGLHAGGRCFGYRNEQGMACGWLLTKPRLRLCGASSNCRRGDLRLRRSRRS
jgi:DNA invertase Pin-like site-specific DNA recombinase